MIDPRYSPGVMMVARITGSEKEMTWSGSGKSDGLETKISFSGSAISRALKGTVGDVMMTSAATSEVPASVDVDHPLNLVLGQCGSCSLGPLISES